FEALPTPVTPKSGEALALLLDRIKQVPDDGSSTQHKARLQEKVANAAQTYLAKIALLYNRNQFLAEINREGRTRRTADSKVIGTARVVTYEDLEKKRAERVILDAKEAEKKAKRAAKAVKDVKSAATEVEGAATGTKKRGRKRKSPALVEHSTEPAGVSEPKAKVARMSEEQVEDEVLPEPWRAPVARMW
ncbi:hypothetical protein IQ07DRAFT_485595, partial [Pyrenochaeta sp. DS3sAY3a]